MADGSSRQEIDYLIKKAWLEQHDQTQLLAKDEVWQLVAGFSPDEGTRRLLRPARSGWTSGGSTCRSTTA